MGGGGGGAAAAGARGAGPRHRARETRAAISPKGHAPFRVTRLQFSEISVKMSCVPALPVPALRVAHIKFGHPGGVVTVEFPAGAATQFKFGYPRHSAPVGCPSRSLQAFHSGGPRPGGAGKQQSRPSRASLSRQRSLSDPLTSSLAVRVSHSLQVCPGSGPSSGRSGTTRRSWPGSRATGC